MLSAVHQKTFRSLASHGAPKVILVSIQVFEKSRRLSNSRDALNERVESDLRAT